MDYLDGQVGEALGRAGAGTADWRELCAQSRERARRLFADLAPAHRAVVTDSSPWETVLGARRSGKTWLQSARALIVGEANPGSIVIIGSLTLKSLRRNFWFGASSGIPKLARKYGIDLRYNKTDLTWEHPNGSIGYLLNCETRESLEYWRGMEADLYELDECKSMPPGVLRELIEDIISPQRISRRGIVALHGTPGAVLAGPFYEGTNPQLVHPKGSPQEGLPFCVPFGENDPGHRAVGEFWSFHRLRMQDNEAMPHQWQEMLAEKARRGWTDSNPTWRREALAEWVGSDDLIFAYLDLRDNPDVETNWSPEPTAGNPTGLPPELGPWHLVFGLDLGFENPTALVVVAWSETTRELRHVYDVQRAHLTPDGVLELVRGAVARFGQPEVVVADAGALGKGIVEWLGERGIPVERAEKSEKYDNIEIVNGEFRAGRVRVIPGTELEDQLCAVQWDTRADDKETLARRGKLREDPSCANDLTDAFLYAARHCYHWFARRGEEAPAPGTPAAEERRALDEWRNAARSERARMASEGRPPTGRTLPWGGWR